MVNCLELISMNKTLIRIFRIGENYFCVCTFNILKKILFLLWKERWRGVELSEFLHFFLEIVEALKIHQFEVRGGEVWLALEGVRPVPPRHVQDLSMSYEFCKLNVC